MTVQPAELLVAIPALNEERTVAGVVRDIHRAVPEAVIVVVDDGSTDATADVARAAGAQVLCLPFNVGVGAAMRTAFLYAVREGFSAVVQVDADGQHDAKDIERLLAGLGQASVVIGARFDKGEYPVRGPRRWAMRVLAGVLSRITGSRLTDTTSGFRASDRLAIELFAKHYPAEYLGDTVESLVIAARAGLRVGEVPVSMRQRQDGVPSTGPLRSTLYLGRALLALTIAMLGSRRPIVEDGAA